MLSPSFQDDPTWGIDEIEENGEVVAWRVWSEGPSEGKRGPAMIRRQLEVRRDGDKWRISPVGPRGGPQPDTILPGNALFAFFSMMRPIVHG